MIQTDKDGNKLYQLQAMKFTDHRFNKKFMPQVDIMKMGIKDPNDDGIAWKEFYFKFPSNDSNSKMF